MSKVATAAATALCAAVLAITTVRAAEFEPRAQPVEVSPVQPLPLEGVIRRFLPSGAQRQLRASWQRWAPEAERALVVRLKRLPPRWRLRVDAFRRRATRPGGRQLGLAATAALLALLIAIRLRRRGDVVVSIEYPAEFRGSFSVRILRRRSLARRTPRRLRALQGRAASTRITRHMVARETQFHGFRPGRHWISVEGELRDSVSGAVHREFFEVRSVNVRALQTIRTEFDFSPTLCPLTVAVAWNGQPAVQASVALGGQPQSLRYTHGGRARLEAPLGKHRVVVGSSDRVAECEVEVESLRPFSIDVDLGGSQVLFKGCPHAVEPYLRGDLSAAARALADEGQAELSKRFQARVHESNGQTQRAAALYRQGGDWENAVRLLSQVPEGDPSFADACVILADYFESEGDLEQAISKLEQAIAAAPDEMELPELYSRLAILLEQCEALPRALDVLEQLRAKDPDHPSLNTRIETLRKKISREFHTSGRRSDEPWPGGSRYQILEQIGAGGMGVVFRARDRRLGREVALKRLPENLKDHPMAVALFRREARAAAALNHPNIVTLFDADEEDGRFFITMELLSGDPLSLLRRRFRHLEARDVALLGRQVAAGLHYAHESRIIHRDIKPPNLFFTCDKVLKIMDFGLAKMIEEVRRRTTVLGGTPFYMAPELSSGVGVDTPVDMYALGITLFELLTGRVPFRDGDVAHDHRHTQPPDPRDLVEGVPDALASLILELLAKRPQDRPSAAAARDRLDVLARLPGRATPSC